jgi:Fe-S-cluster-containing hydrogenase component 2
VEEYDYPVEYNPCLECKLCVAACPVGAIGPDGSFNFSSCFTHNYREFLGGFTDWIEQVADARDAIDYRRRINEPETMSMWQSLSHGANYKSAYCMAVCPAGEDVIGPCLEDRQRHLKEVVRPLQKRPEPVYVVEGSAAEAVARRKFKNKIVKTVGNGLKPRTISGLLNFMPFVFQPNQARGLNATFDFTFAGAEERQATITIRNCTLDIKDGLIGKADIRVTADAKTWLGFLAAEKHLVLALLRRKIRLKGDPRLLLAFGKCFPSPRTRHRPVEIVPQPSMLKREPAQFFQLVRLGMAWLLRHEPDNGSRGDGILLQPNSPQPIARVPIRRLLSEKSIDPCRGVLVAHVACHRLARDVVGCFK